MQNIYFVGPNTYTNPIIKYATIQDVVRYMDSVNEFAFDTETTGLDPHSSRVIMIQVGDNNLQFVIDARSIDVTPILPFLTDKHKAKVGANLSFDYMQMLGSYGIRMNNLKDIMIREMVLECGAKSSGFSLKHLSKQYLNIEMPKDVRGEFQFIRHQAFTDRQIVYGARDVEIPTQIAKQQQHKILSEELGVTVHLEQEFVRVVGEMQYHGLPVDLDRWEEIYKQNVTALTEREQALDDYVINNNLTPFLGPIDMFTGRPQVRVSWTSNKQVAPVFKHEGIPIEVLDRDKMANVKDRYGIEQEYYKDVLDKEMIMQLADHYELANLFGKYKKAVSAVTKYGMEYMDKYLNKTTLRLHSGFRQILSTGRISSSNPNVQQIPSYKSPEKPSFEAHRTAFIAPEGWTFVVRDYSSQESRLLADMAGEESMIHEYLHGTGDLHSLTGTKVFSLIEGKPVTVNKKENSHYRQIAKTVNFGVAYGGTAGTLSRKLNIDRDKATHILDSFGEAYPQLTEYFKKRHDEILTRGFLVLNPLTKRRIYFPEHKKYLEGLSVMNLYHEKKYQASVLGLEQPEYPEEIAKDTKRIKSALMRKAQNFPIQGTSADMTKIALVMFYNHLRDNNLFDDVKIVLALHDEIVLECKEGFEEAANKHLEICMNDAGNMFLSKLQMLSDGGATKVWDH